MDPDSVILLENNMSVIQGDSLDYKQLIDYMSTCDISTAEAYNYLDKKIDLEECILYFAAQAYYDNMDWPGGNIKFWRERKSTGKWRWILLDLDFGFGLYAHGAWEDHIQFMFSTVETRYSNPPWATFFQRKLIENPVIKNRFINQIADLLNTNFKSTRVVEVINALANHISGEIGRHRTRWGLAGENLNKLTAFANDRPAFLRTHVRNYFKCGDDGTISVSSTKGGSVRLNTLNLDEKEMPFSGIYFQGNEVHLKAVAAPGYKFDGWSGAADSKEDSITIQVSRTTNLLASFSIADSASKEIVINEINYNSAADFDAGDWIELYNRGEQPVDIGNWYYSDSDDSHKFIFQEGTVINPGDYLVIIEKASSFNARFPDVKNYVGETGFGLSGSGEFMKLVNKEGQIVDSLTYDDNSPWPEEADGKGATLELSDAGRDNSLGGNWKASIGHGTPGKINSMVTSVRENEIKIIPGEFSLRQNYPNPFNPITVIEYSVPGNSYVSLKVYDLLGREVAILFEGSRRAGHYAVSFNASELTSGIYFYTMSSDNFIQTKKLILLK